MQSLSKWLTQEREKWLKQPINIRAWQLTASIVVLAIAASAVIVVVRYGFGFGEGSSKTITTTTRDANGNVIQTVTETPDSGKTLWDWLSLLGVPLSLAGLGYVFQQQQQKRAEAEAKEEVLQVYFDRLSTLLVDKNLLAIAAKVYPREPSESHREISPDEQALFDLVVGIIRARTLSILRKFADDVERKNSVIRFLIEVEVVSKARLNLTGASLSGVSLSGADLSNANLSNANLSGTKLWVANLKNIKFNLFTKWPDKEEVAKAEDIPLELMEQLGIEPKTEPPIEPEQKTEQP